MSGGENVGAFFDIDGTLMPGPSLEWRFVARLASRREIRVRSAGRWLRHAAGEFLCGRSSAAERNKFYLAGLHEQLVSDWADSLVERPISFFQPGVERIAWHVSEGHRVVLVSGTLAPLARVIAANLSGHVDAIATVLETKDGCWTGCLASPHVSEKEKALAAAKYAESQGLQLESSYAYGNEMRDAAMLELVGLPTAVNPSPHLERAALLRGWRACEWRQLSRAQAGVSAGQLAVKEAR